MAQGTRVWSHASPPSARAQLRLARRRALRLPSAQRPFYAAAPPAGGYCTVPQQQPLNYDSGDGQRRIRRAAERSPRGRCGRACAFFASWPRDGSVALRSSARRDAGDKAQRPSSGRRRRRRPWAVRALPSARARRAPPPRRRSRRSRCWAASPLSRSAAGRRRRRHRRRRAHSGAAALAAEPPARRRPSPPGATAARAAALENNAAAAAGASGGGGARPRAESRAGGLGREEQKCTFHTHTHALALTRASLVRASLARRAGHLRPAVRRACPCPRCRAAARGWRRRSRRAPAAELFPVDRPRIAGTGRALLRVQRLHVRPPRARRRRKNGSRRFRG